MTCAASCRISSSASGSVRTMILTLASASIGSARSASLPSSAISYRLLGQRLGDAGRQLEPVRPFLKDRLLPSGKVSEISLTVISSHSLHTKQVRWVHRGRLRLRRRLCARAGLGVAKPRAKYGGAAHHSRCAI